MVAIIKEHHLLRYFLIYSLIAFIITAVILGATIAKFIEKQQLENVLKVTTIAVHAFVEPELIDYDFKN